MNETTKTTNATLPDATDAAFDLPLVDPAAPSDKPKEEPQPEAAGSLVRGLAPRLPDSMVLGLGGGGLLALSAAFLWHDLHLSPAHLVTAGASAGLGASMMLRRRHIAGLGLIGLFAATLFGGTWYALDKTVMLMPTIAVILLGAALNVAFAYPQARHTGNLMRVRQIFVLLVLAVLVGTSAFYFQFLTLGVECLGRRLVLTLLWALLGVGLVIQGSRLKETAMRDSGYVLLLAAMLKALLYDTTHLAGTLRVSVLGISGALLLAGSLLSRRRHS